ncbi:hypothetical protein BASA61_005093 [Batrachochytrium salamandrivorans]|nr:hypothetical protein BASA61_005093 [Batrachochytrium salamandrivorans]
MKSHGQSLTSVARSNPTTFSSSHLDSSIETTGTTRTTVPIGTTVPSVVLVPDSPLAPNAVSSINVVTTVPCTPKNLTDRMVYNGVALVPPPQMNLGCNSPSNSITTNGTNSNSNSNSNSTIDSPFNPLDNIKTFLAGRKRTWPSAVVIIPSKTTVTTVTTTATTATPTTPAAVVSCIDDHSELSSPVIACTGNYKESSLSESNAQLVTNNKTVDTMISYTPNKTSLIRSSSDTPITHTLGRAGSTTPTTNSSSSSSVASRTFPAASSSPLTASASLNSWSRTTPHPSSPLNQKIRSNSSSDPDASNDSSTAYRPISPFMFSKTPVGVPSRVSENIRSFVYTGKSVRKPDSLFTSSTLWGNSASSSKTASSSQSSQRDPLVRKNPIESTSAVYTRPSAASSKLPSRAAEQPNQSYTNSLSSFKYDRKSSNYSSSTTVPPRKMTAHDLKINELATIFPTSSHSSLEKALDVANGSVRDAITLLRGNTDAMADESAETVTKRRKLVRKIDLSDRRISEGNSGSSLVKPYHSLDPVSKALKSSKSSKYPNIDVDDDDDDDDILNANIKFSRKPKSTNNKLLKDPYIGNTISPVVFHKPPSVKRRQAIAMSEDDDIAMNDTKPPTPSVVHSVSDVESIADDAHMFDGDYSGNVNDDIEEDTDIMTQVVAFFNTATAECMTETLKCALEASTMIVSLRPFSCGAHLRELCTSGCKIQRKLVRLVDRYEGVLEGFCEVDTLIERCELVGADIKSIMVEWVKSAAAAAATVTATSTTSDLGVGSNADLSTRVTVVGSHHDSNEVTSVLDETNGEMSLTQTAAALDAIDADGTSADESDSSTVTCSGSDADASDQDINDSDADSDIAAALDIDSDVHEIDDEDEDKSFALTQNPKQGSNSKSTILNNDTRSGPLSSRSHSTHKETDSTPTVFKCLTKQPRLVSKHRQLKQYQIVGVSWLTMLYHKKLGGILADEMGLGKTAQVICFLAHLLSMGERGPHMIIVPSSTLDNWLREFHQWCPKLRVHPYTGTLTQRREYQEDIMSDPKLNVIVTTYNMAAGTKEDRSFLRKLRIKSLILDEGHMVKNIESIRYKHLMAISAPFRLLLTGTPLQNNLLELLALLTFVMPRLFITDQKTLERIFLVKSVGTGDGLSLSRERIDRAKKIMTPFVLRRRKDQVLKDLPAKTHVLNMCDAVVSQRQLYQDILSLSKKSTDTDGSSSTSVSTKGLMPDMLTDGMNSLPISSTPETASLATRQLTNILMDLRKVANHPLLVRSRYTDAKLRVMAKTIMQEPEHRLKNVDYIWEDMTVLTDFEIHQLCLKYRSLKPHKLDDSVLLEACKVIKLKSLLLEMRERGDKVLLFSQFVIMLDILEPVMQLIGIKFIRLDGSTPVALRQGLVDQFNTDSDLTVFLLSTKSGGVGINLTSANVVIMYDIDFNPHNDAQAEDRAHRVGQTREVTVHRLIMNDSIEQHILQCAEHKLLLDARLQGRGCNQDVVNKDTPTASDDDGSKDDRGDNDPRTPPDSSILDVLRQAILALN